MDHVFVYVGFGAEQFDLGGLLELLDELFEAALLVEIAGNGFQGRCGVGFDGGGESAAEDARQRHRFRCRKRNDGVKTGAMDW
jgi:hypothetical protein